MLYAWEGFNLIFFYIFKKIIQNKNQFIGYNSIMLINKQIKIFI